MKTIQGLAPFLSDKEVNNLIHTQYSISESDFTLLGHLRSNIYQLDSKYIFKIFGSAYHTLAHIQGEVELLHILHQQGINISYPIEDKNREFVQTLKSGNITYHGVLFSYAEGEAYERMNVEQIKLLGRELGQIHNITADLNLQHPLPAFDLNSILTVPLKKMEPAFHKMKEAYNYVLEVGNKVLLYLDQLDLSTFDKGYIHNDLNPYNIHFQDNRITIFDFDNAGKGYFIQDLVSIYAYLFNEVRFD